MCKTVISQAPMTEIPKCQFGWTYISHND